MRPASSDAAWPSGLKMNSFQPAVTAAAALQAARFDDLGRQQVEELADAVARHVVGQGERGREAPLPEWLHRHADSLRTAGA
jgi:hypothetical protein